VSSLEPRSTKISAMLSRQGAMLEELRGVIDDIDPENAREDLRRLILEENVLRRSSLSSRREVHRKLGERYFRKETPKASSHFVTAFRRISEQSQTGLLAFTLLLWNDGLTFELSQRWLAPKLHGPTFEAETTDIERELEFLEEAQPVIKSWNSITRKRVARHYLSTIRDCGYAIGSAKKKIRRPYISPQVILFAVQLILGEGESVVRVPEHELFTAMGLSLQELIGALEELDRQGVVRFASQGGAIHLELTDVYRGNNELGQRKTKSIALPVTDRRSRQRDAFSDLPSRRRAFISGGL
jgi:hypothetical protein